MKIELKDVIEAIEFENELLTHYYDKKTGTIIYIEDEGTSSYKAEDIEQLGKFEEWEQELIKILHDFKINSSDYIQLPNKNQINEIEMLTEFSKLISDNMLDEAILEEVEEEKKYKKLIEHVRSSGKINEWYDYREKLEYDLAKRWCTNNNIEYIEA